ncbi:MAG: hypothetical protein NC231_01590 [Bacillus sp. (in: Bacteria)]|nr:hypothetical protein [Bacillus sp. (in: firmicutes)]MCM1427257.1 hypothetical protein [Eubacterium sp.]
MIIGFITWSIVAGFYAAIGISCCKSHEAVGFFTFVKPPVVQDVAAYNRAVSVIWFAAAFVLELIGIPFLFAEQNSPIFIFTVLAAVVLMIGMIIAYFRIEMKYRK